MMSIRNVIIPVEILFQTNFFLGSSNHPQKARITNVLAQYGYASKPGQIAWGRTYSKKRYRHDIQKAKPSPANVFHTIRGFNL